MSLYAEACSALDAVAGALLIPLAAWILLSGVDDLFIDCVAAAARWKNRTRARLGRRDLLAQPQSRIAIFVPCWREDAVIASMVDCNVRRLAYSNYDIFIGAYPNDPATIARIEELQRKHGNVSLAMCPHPGPTSKADCLNWIYQRMLLHESEQGDRYDIIVTHDAEDVIHSDALHWINRHLRTHDMVQLPVLPLPTPISHWTHGVYCDDFCESHSRDMPARQFMGGFVPSSGVGTGFTRSALEALAASSQNRIFEPVCLTEDYENGLRLRLLGRSQWFVHDAPDGVATRAFFPQTFFSAVRQRTRWVTGISLQTWDRHGWRGSAVQKYWLWRDRKGLLGSPATLLANVLTVYLLVRSLDLGPTVAGAMGASALLATYRLSYRVYWSTRHYGWRFGFTAPLRVVWGNLINTVATCRALRTFLGSKLRHEPLVWVKTEHQYPSAAALTARLPRLGEVLVGNGYLSAPALGAALARKPAGLRLGEYLVREGLLDEDSLYEALSLQHDLPQRRVEVCDVRRAVARALPESVACGLHVVPFKIEAGALFVAGPEIPGRHAEAQLQRYTSLELRFHLITPANYRALVSALL